VVTLHVDGRSSNRHLIDADALRCFRGSGMLINTSRGFVIDNQALARWAREHPEAQAVLDVHEPEPPPPDYPLWGLPNVRLMPHLAARTQRAMQNMSWVVHDVLAVLEGRRAENPAPTEA